MHSSRLVSWIVTNTWAKESLCHGINFNDPAIGKKVLSGSPSLKPLPPGSELFPVTSNKKIADANWIPEMNNFFISSIGNLLPLIMPEVSLIIASTYLTFGYFL